MKASSQTLSTLFHLTRHPVGIRFLDENTSTTAQDLAFMPVKHRAYYCWLVKQASLGKAYRVTDQNLACDTAGWVTGLLPEDHFGTPQENVEGWFNCQTYADYAVAKSIYEGMAPLQPTAVGLPEGKAPRTLLVGSLQQFTEANPPDVVIFVGPPASIMRIVQSYAAHFGWGTQMKVSGMCGICYEATVQPLQLKALSLSTLCSGTRFVAKWGVDEMAAGIPYAQLHTLLEGALQTVGPCETNSVKRSLAPKLAEKHRTFVLRPSYFKQQP